MSYIFTDPDFIQLSKICNTFCPFEAMGVSGYEIRHGNFIANIIDPLGRHGFGDAILKDFLIQLFSESKRDDLKKCFDSYNFIDAKIHREKKGFENKLSLDIAIELPRFHNEKCVILIVEMKLNSTQRDGQLSDYKKLSEKIWKYHEHIFFYMTINRDNPNDSRWISINYDPIINSINSFLGKEKQHCLAQQMLQSYVALLEYNFNQNNKKHVFIKSLWEKYEIELKEFRKGKAVSDKAQQITLNDILEYEPFDKDKIVLFFKNRTKFFDSLNDRLGKDIGLETKIELKFTEINNKTYIGYALEGISNINMDEYD